MIYNILVRDRIPAIIRAEGRTCEVVVLDDDACRQALRVKLVEEAWEAETATGAELVTELADVLEVVDALIVAHGIAREVVEEQERCRVNRGGFDQRLFLVRTE